LRLRSEGIVSKRRIGILGSGNVGMTLGSGLVRLGYDVMLGSADPRRSAIPWATHVGRGAHAGTHAEAAQFGELAILATRWHVTQAAVADARAALAGKIVVDATNPLVFHGHDLPTLALANDDSAGEQVQRWLPQSRVVKAFNAVGVAQMVAPAFRDGPPDMFICGDELAAKRVVGELCRTLGWNAFDLGGITRARLLEPLAILWIAISSQRRQHDHVLTMLVQ
jgi:8-hydroxy-5-deazaflavin:NADPH oxidoreductase